MPSYLCATPAAPLSQEDPLAYESLLCVESDRIKDVSITIFIPFYIDTTYPC